MNRTGTMTSKGQITIPQALRLALGLETGTRLQFELVRGELRARPLRSTTWADLWHAADATPAQVKPVDVKTAILDAVKARSHR
jgi:AbrB family looped-hinge helix DNA binding protein